MVRTLLALLVAALLFPVVAAQGEGMTVAVVDSGVDSQHSELQGKVTRKSFADYAPIPGSGLPGGVDDPLDPGMVREDPDGQGTAVASLIAGRTLGMAPGVQILDLQVSGGYTDGAVDRPMEDAAIAALDWLLAQDEVPRVVVLGFAVHTLSESSVGTLQEQVRGLWERGVVVVVPASAVYTGLHRSPHVLTVAGLNGDTPTDVAAPESITKPNVAAQATGLEVAVPGTTPGDSPTAAASGTHLAAAQAAAATAMAFEMRANLPAPALVAILQAGATDVGPAGFDARTGFGTIDAMDAVARAVAWQDPIPLDAEEIDSRDGPLPLAVALVALIGLAVAVRRK